jgi:prepilin-type N-terminal cleavage/methylation domain-containing protein
LIFDLSFCYFMKGFTIIELLVVIAITLILAAAAVPIYGSLQVSSQLNENSSLIVQALRSARTNSVARVNNAAHGVYFEINAGGDDKYILYQGASYASRNSSYDRATTLDSSLSLSTTFTGDEVDFSRGLGVPDNIGSVTLTHAVQGTRIITVNDLGMVQE